MIRHLNCRRSFRLTPPGVACVRWSRRTRRYAVGDLSLGGALLLGAPVPEVGARVDATLRMRGIHRIAICGRVVRTANTGVRPGFALRFTKLPIGAEDAIHDLWVIERERAAAPTVLLVSRSPHVRDVLAEFLQRQGWSVATAGTPLEALAELECLAEKLHWVIAFHHLTQTSGMNLLSFSGSEYPGVRRLLVCPPTVQRIDRLAVRRGLADAAILQPVNPVDIATAMGKPAHAPC